MEVKKDWQQPWFQAGFKTEEEWLEWWVSVLGKSISETQDKLNDFRKEHWESELQLAGFINRLCESTNGVDLFMCTGFFPVRIVRVFSVSNSNNFVLGDVLALELKGYDGKFYRRFDVKEYLLSFVGSGYKWYEIAKKTIAEIEEILNIAKRIRRNLLYPEVTEMERKLESLSFISEEMVSEINSLKSQLAEKEKETGELKKDWKRKIVHWRTKLDSICSQLINTKSIFKSKRIADIRDQVQKLDYEVWEAYGQLDK